MTVLAEGALTDRPWGRTLMSLAARGISAQVDVASGGKTYSLVLEGGAVTGARSPLATDAAARLALTAGMITSTHVAEHARRARAEPGVDEVSLLAQIAGLSPDVTLRLRRRVIATQAIRPFAFDDGLFRIHDEFTVAGWDEAAIDTRALILLGARTHVGEPALRHALGRHSWQLTDDGAELLPQYGITSADNAVIRALQAGATADDLARLGPDPRPPLAVAYALVVTGAAVAAAAASRPVAGPVDPPTERFERKPPPAAAPAVAAPPPTAAARPPEPPTNRVRRARTTMTPEQRTEIEELVATLVPMLGPDVDHFALLGVSRASTDAEIRAAYFALAKKLHSDRLTAGELVDTDRTAHRLFSAINESFKVLSTPRLRAEFERVVAAGGREAMRAREAEAEEMARRILLAEDHFRRGEQALRREALELAQREFAEATRLNPEEQEYRALLAWTTFAAAADKPALAARTRAELERAVSAAPKSAAPRFYLGRLERLLGNDAAALGRFREVLAVAPSHAEAASELRLLEARAGKKR
jgi:hypothetical protein